MVQLRRLSHALGAEVVGLDISQPIAPQTAAELRDAWLQYNVLLFRDQQLTPEQHIAFSRNFGELEDHATRPHDRLPGHPELIAITNRPLPDGSPSPSRNTGRDWHTDLSYTLHPAKGSLLYCVEIPEAGGTTMFANMYMAWDTLSDGMKKLLSPLEAVHDVTAIKSFASRDPAQVREIAKLNPPVAQPVARIHPVTGRRALYVTESVTTNFVGMTQEESRPLLEYLFAHAVQYEFTYRHQWRPGDLLMWDNRCTLHRALADYSQATERRYMLRTTLLGEPSGRLLDDDQAIAA